MIENLVLKRIYEEVDANDGNRILVDRIWPRGISKDVARLDLWMKEIAPSTALRKEFNHRPERFEEFKGLYINELMVDEEKMAAIEELLGKIEIGKVTLLYGARDEVHNHAVVLMEVLKRELDKRQND
ncbi:DUF488 domain-containing protein [Bacillus sinesaloumensis]|uniref:DUF488 domain-containing protein n=1 Tax=Litchfieldia sinesaloumensis TaxID=1926280 RepID=UPI0009884FC5|nr:DUF488 family protein [Bacillus sinesaloumensis]